MTARWKPTVTRLVVLSLLAFPAGLGATTIHVPADFPTIQAGLDAAQALDVVLVAPGTYRGDGNRNLVFHNRTIILRSEAGPEATIIDAEGSAPNPERAFVLWYESATPVIDGFTIRGGYAAGPAFPENHGGGILCVTSSPRVMRCIFTQNYGDYGGAISCNYSSVPVIIECEFIGNETITFGGGLHCLFAEPFVSGCTFSGNRAEIEGGGVSLRISSGTLSGCVFLENVADLGGGLYAQHSPMTVEGCTFIGNRAHAGGGLRITGEFARVQSCRFIGNIADPRIPAAAGGRGGGISIWYASPEIKACTFAGNRATGELTDDPGLGGAILVESPQSSPTVTSCTIAGNTGERAAGIDVLEAELHLQNTIVAFGEVGAAVVCSGGGRAVVACTDLFGNAGGDWTDCVADQLGINGNLAADPRFCDPPNGDYTLDASSRCAEGNTGDCGRIGAWPVGCGTTSIEPTTWGALKAAFGR